MNLEAFGFVYHFSTYGDVIQANILSGYFNSKQEFEQALRINQIKFRCYETTSNC